MCVDRQPLLRGVPRGNYVGFEGPEVGRVQTTCMRQHEILDKHV